MKLLQYLNVSITLKVFLNYHEMSIKFRIFKNLAQPTTSLSLFWVDLSLYCLTMYLLFVFLSSVCKSSSFLSCSNGACVMWKVKDLNPAFTHYFLLYENISYSITYKNVYCLTLRKTFFFYVP